MFAKLTLLLCAVFIVTVFYVDRKRNGRQSFALWLPLVWLSLSISKPISFWMNPVSSLELLPSTSDYLSGNPVDRNILSGLMLLAVIVLFKRKVPWKNYIKNNAPIIVFFMYFGISILWSDYPAIALKRWVRTCGDLLLVMIVATDVNPVEAFKWVLRGCGYLLIPLSVVLIKYFRDLGVLYSDQGATMWSGVAGHKNSLGQLACVISVFFVWSYFSDKSAGLLHKVIKLLYIAMAMWLLNGSSSGSSMTSKVVFVFALIMYFGLTRLQKKTTGPIDKKITAVLISAALIYMIFLTLFPGALTGILVEQTGRDMTLTGRTDLWADLMVIGMRSPVLGTGYGSFWIGDLTHNLWDKHIWKPTQAHNGYIDVYINLGLVGVGLLFVVLISVYKKILYAMIQNFEFNSFKFVLFFMIIIYNITESSISKPTTFLWFLFLILAVSYEEIRAKTG